MVRCHGGSITGFMYAVVLVIRSEFVPSYQNSCHDSNNDNKDLL